MCTVLQPPGVNPIAVNNIYHIIYRIISYHIISYHIISYHIISYHIISYHIISYIIYHISHRIIYHISHRIIYHISHRIIYRVTSCHVSCHVMSCHVVTRSCNVCTFSAVLLPFTRREPFYGNSISLEQCSVLFRFPRTV